MCDCPSPSSPPLNNAAPTPGGGLTVLTPFFIGRGRHPRRPLPLPFFSVDSRGVDGGVPDS